MKQEPDKPPPKSEDVGLTVPLPWGGAVKASGFDVVFLAGFVVLGVMLYKQNDLLHQQTIELRTERIAEHTILKCNIGIDIFVHQFPRGEVNWDLLPVQLYSCLPDYTKKMPAERGK